MHTACASSTDLSPSPSQESPQVQLDTPTQDYFSARPILISPFPEHISLPQVAGRITHARNTSSDSTISHSNFLHPCCRDLGTSPSQRAISFSSWTRYSPSAATSPSGQLKASLLCRGSGTTSSYDPPVSEWTFLGADQPAFTGKPFKRSEFHRRKKTSCSSSTLSSVTLANDGSDAITFTKQPVKRASTSSQLTASFKESSLGSIREGISVMQRLGLEGMTCEDLPSAFDDSEDEED